MFNRGGEVVCDSCNCTAKDSIDAGKRGWDWFTGFGKNTYHNCRSCLLTRYDEFRHLRNISMSIENKGN